jgi:hypothetical protein
VTEQRDPIHDDVPVLQQEAIDCICQVARHLLHVRLVRLFGDAGKLHASSCQVYDEQNTKAKQSSPRDGFDCEEVHGSDGAPVRA